MKRQIKFQTILDDLLQSNNSQRNRSDLCKELDISTSMLSQYTHGHSRPSFDKLIKIAEWFDVPLDYLVFGGQQATKPVDYGPIVHYVDESLLNLQKLTENRTELYARVATALSREIDFKINEIIREDGQFRAIGRGILDFLDTEYIEMCSNETCILTMNMQFDVKELEDGSVTAGHFVSIVSQNLTKGRKYRFLLPKTIDWTNTVEEYLRILHGSCGSDTELRERCQFRVTDAPVVNGFGLHNVDIRQAARVAPTVLSRIQDSITPEGWMGYVIPAYSVPTVDYLMDRKHVLTAIAAYDRMWAAASPVGRRAHKKSDFLRDARKNSINVSPG